MNRQHESKIKKLASRQNAGKPQKSTLLKYQSVKGAKQYSVKSKTGKIKTYNILEP